MTLSDWTNLFDLHLSIEISKPWQLGASITGAPDLLSLVRNRFGGTIAPKNQKSLELGALSLYQIASELKDQSCLLQRVYQTIDYIRSLKESKVNDGQYQQYRKDMKDAIDSLRSVYQDTKSTRRKKLCAVKIEAKQQAKEAKAIARSAATQARKVEKKHQAAEKSRLKREGRENEIKEVQGGHMTCRKCQTTLSIGHFNKAVHSHTGYSLYCKACCKRDHYLPNREINGVRARQWTKDHPEETRKARRKEQVKPHRRVRSNISKRIKDYLKATKTATKWRDIISCTPRELVTYLESQFTANMSWANYGILWHIDHIIPCAAFDWARPRHLEWCWHHKNLRPLLATENMTKRDALSTGESAASLWRDDLERLKKIVGNDLEGLGITSRAEYDASWESTPSMRYLMV